MKSWIKKLFGIVITAVPRKTLHERIESNVEGFSSLLDIIGNTEHSRNSNTVSVPGFENFYGIVCNIPPTRILKDNNFYTNEILIPLYSKFLTGKHISAMPKDIKFPLDTLWSGNLETIEQLKNIIKQ